MNSKIEDYEFLTPTKKLREYLLLNAMDKTENPSQRDLSQAAGISPSVVNKYLSEFEQLGLITKEPLNKRDYKYSLTEEGKNQKQELMVKYIRETFQMFSEGKRELGEKLDSYQKQYGYKKIIFYSAGEVTELLIHSLNQKNLSLLAIVDDNQAKQGGQLFGYPIISPEEISEYKPDAVIVTTFRYREEIIHKLEKMNNSNFDIIGF